MKNKIALVACLFQLFVGGVFAQNIRFSFSTTSTGATSTANVYVQNIGASAENLVGFSLVFYYNNAETTLTSFDLSPLTALGWTTNSTTSAFVVTNNATVSITHTGYRELSGVIDDNLVGTNLPSGGSPILVAKANFDNTIGNPTGGSAYLAATVSNNHPALQYVGLPANSYNFAVTGLQAQALPLELTYFKAKAAEKTIDLFWQTENEKDFSGFEIERSDDGFRFEKIGFEKGKGQNGRSDYAFSDATVLVGKDYFYRLKMLDLDGRFSFSSIEKARIEGFSKAKISPNPVRDILNMEIETGQIAPFSIFDAAGKVLFSGLLNEKGLSQINVSSLAEGFYVLRVFSAGGEAQDFRFLKQGN